MNDKLKEDIAREQRKAMKRMRIIDYQVDTLRQTNLAQAYYRPSKNSIIVNYVEGDEKFNNLGLNQGVLIHEQKHRDNNNAGLYAYPMSKEQVYKLVMHDEISANIATLIYMRDEYLKTKNLDVFNGDKMFTFYTDAIKSGEIDPFSSSKKDFDKEMAFIVNGIRDVWIQKYARVYEEEHYAIALDYGEKDETHAKFFDQNYERAKKIAYNIGGVDFTKYMDKDIEIPNMDKKNISTNENDWLKENGLPEYDGSMSLLQYQKLLQHAYILKSSPIMQEGLIIDQNKTIKDKSQLDVNNIEELLKNREQYIQNRENLEISYYDSFLGGDIEETTNLENIIIGIAKDYEKKGKKLPKDNDNAYNEAVDKLYDVEVRVDSDDKQYVTTINLRNKINLLDVIPVDELPSEAEEIQQKIENMGLVERMKLAISTKFIQNQAVRPVKEDNTPQYSDWSEEKRVSSVQYTNILDLRDNVIKKASHMYRKIWQDEQDKSNKTNENSLQMQISDREVLKQNIQASARDKEQMIKVIEGMSRVNGTKKALDVTQTVDTLYNKFDNKAHKPLEKSADKPLELAQDISNSSIQISSDANGHLSNSDKTNDVVTSVLGQNER